jgi:hypothetical protein
MAKDVLGGLMPGPSGGRPSGAEANSRAPNTSGHALALGRASDKAARIQSGGLSLGPSRHRALRAWLVRRRQFGM